MLGTLMTKLYSMTLAAIVLTSVMFLQPINAPITGQMLFQEYHRIERDSPYKTVAFTKNDIACLAQVILFETGNQSIRGKIAAAEVVLNRVLEKQPKQKTICQVVYFHKGKRYAFSFLDANHKHYVHTASDEWRRSILLAKFIITRYNNHRLKDYALGATFFHADYINPPKWADDLIQTCHIGNHIFYRKKT